MRPPLVSIRSIHKRFATVHALAGVDLDLRAGEVHAVLGENGAGKSTLMHVLDGMCAPDSGQILLDGKPVRFASPGDAQRAGIGMVHQHFTLIDALTVAENLALSLPDGPTWIFDHERVADAVRAMARGAGLELPPPETVVETLPVGVRQRLEVLKALAGAGRVLILDEPTAVLTPQEVRQLFEMLRQLRADDRLIIFITHKLPEVMEIADRVSVMRSGRVVGTFDVAQVGAARLAELMVGDFTTTLAPPAPSGGDAIALEVEGLTSRRKTGTVSLDGVRLSIRRGEILGIAGVDGNGQRELFDALAGLAMPVSGTIRVDGKSLRATRPADVLAAGIGLIPPDRQREGLVLAMSVEENLLLHRRTAARFSRYGLLDRRAAREHARRLVERYKIKCASLDSPVSTLSGGNQQRVIVARELSEEPAVLVTVNPTRGLDLAASRAVAESLRDAAGNGCAVLLISTDLDEVLDLSNRVAVLFRGRLSTALPRPFDVERVGRLMAGINDRAQEESNNRPETSNQKRETRNGAPR